MEIKISKIKDLEKVVGDILSEIKNDFGKRAMMIALCGPMGAGKTALTKILAKKLGINEEITSPTFVLHVPHRFKIYDPPAGEAGLGFVNFDHIDLWRVEKWEEVERLGLAEMIENKDLIVVEWADKFRSRMHEFRDHDVRILWVEISYGEKKNDRIIKLD